MHREMETVKEIEKIVLVGEAGSGKSTFLKKKLGWSFDPTYSATIGCEVIPIEGIHYWDTAGQEKFMGLKDGYYLGAHKFYFFIPGNRRPKGEDLDSWLNDMKRVAPSAEIVVIVSIYDLKKKVFVDIIKEYAKYHNLEIRYYSAKNGGFVDV